MSNPNRDDLQRHRPSTKREPITSSRTKDVRIPALLGDHQQLRLHYNYAAATDPRNGGVDLPRV